MFFLRRWWGWRGCIWTWARSSSGTAGGSETPESQSGKTVSSAQSAPGDALPPTTDLGTQEAQLSRGSEDRTYGNRPTPATETSNDPDAPVATAGPAGIDEGSGAVDPSTDATNTGDTPRGPAGTPVANRGVEPEGGSSTR